MTNALRKGTNINNKYDVEGLLSEDEYSISYLATYNNSYKAKIIEVFIADKYKRAKDGTSVVCEFRYNNFLLEKIETEIGYLCYFDFDGVERFIESFRANNTLYFVYSYSDGLSLREYIKNNNNNIAQCEEVYSKINTIVKNMHEYKIAHRGLSENSIKVISGNRVILEYCNIPVYISELAKNMDINKKYYIQEDINNLDKLNNYSSHNLLSMNDSVCYNNPGESVKNINSKIKHSLVVTGQGARNHNEDRYAYSSSNLRQIIIVADGAGGCGKGDIAASMAVEYINQYFTVNHISYRNIKKCIEGANTYIHAKDKDMKTTVVCLLIEGSNCFCVHMGDSRLYQIRNGKLIHKTKDHSIASKLLREGLITEEEALTNRYRNTIYKALGDEQPVEPEIKKLNYKKGDSFLLATDGFWNNITDDEVVKKVNCDGWLHNVEAQIISRNSKTQDNYTAVIWR